MPTQITTIPTLLIRCIGELAFLQFLSCTSYLATRCIGEVPSLTTLTDGEIQAQGSLVGDPRVCT